VANFTIHTIERERYRGDMVWAVNHGYGPRGEADLIAYSWYVEGPDHQILIDSGDPNQTEKLDKGLKDLGVDYEDIDAIVCTHLHIDHNGGFDRFPNARVYVQHEDVAHAINPVPHHRESSSSIDGPNEEVLHEIVDRKQPQELEIKRGDFTLTEGFDVLLVPGHTPGFQTPVISTEKGKVGIFHSKYYTNWFPGDPTFHPEGVEFENQDWFDISSVEGYYPEGVLTESTLTYLDSMQRIADECDIVVPGHDPYIPEKMPEQWYFTDLDEPRAPEDEKEVYREVKQRRHERYPDLQEW
jgi:glyoxylase-like metal-dependent hydrolase (beta-lactamase superfamily II)